MMTSRPWYIFSAAPHRVMFFGGALQTLAVMLWWLTDLTTRYGVFGHPVTWVVRYLPGYWRARADGLPG